LISNLFITRNRPLREGIDVIKFKVQEFSKVKDPSRIFSIARRIGYRLENEFGGTFELIGRDLPEIVLFNPLIMPTQFKLNFIDGSFTIIPHGKMKLLPNGPYVSTLEKIIESIISKKFREMGYEKFKRIYRRPKFKLVYSRAQNPLRFYLDAFIFSASVFKDGKIGLWIDSKGTIDQPANLFIEHKLSQGYSEQEIRKLILEKKMNATLEPGHVTGVITDVIFDRTAGSFILRDDPKRRTLREYWRQEYKKNVPANDIVIMVRRTGFHRDLAYPASLVYLWTRGEQIPFRFMQLLHMSPKNRIIKLQEIVRRLNLCSISLNGQRIVFEEEPIRWENLVKEEKCSLVGSRKKVLLKMGNGKISPNQRDILKYGPFSGNKEINIALVIPSTLVDLSKKFINVLQKYFERFNLGSLNLIEIFEIEKLTPMSYWEKGYEVGRFFDLKKVPNCISIVILPNQETRTTEYFEFRRGIGRAKRLSSKAVQMILPETVREIINEKDKNLIGNFLIQLYLKTLDRGEAVWLLNTPAGGSKQTCYMGYDVARLTERVFDPTAKTWIRERKEAAAYAAVCDSYGRVIECRSLFAQRGEMLTPDDVLRLLYETLHECKTAMKEYYNEDFSRLVIYRDGDIKSTDLKMMELGLQKLFEAVEDKYSRLIIDVVAVIKTGIERVFDDDMTNPNVGNYVILNDARALVCTSDIKKKSNYLSAKPLKLKYVLSKSLDNVDRRAPMEKIVHEFIDLTRLDWVSLAHMPKLALPLILVQQIGKLTLKDVSVPKDVPYIPL